MLFKAYIIMPSSLFDNYCASSGLPESSPKDLYASPLQPQLKPSNMIVGYHSGSDDEGGTPLGTPAKSHPNESLTHGFPDSSTNSKLFCLLPPEGTIVLPKIEKKMQQFRFERGSSASYLKELRQRANFRDPTVLSQLIKRCDLKIQCGTQLLYDFNTFQQIIAIVIIF